MRGWSELRRTGQWSSIDQAYAKSTYDLNSFGKGDITNITPVEKTKIAEAVKWGVKEAEKATASTTMTESRGSTLNSEVYGSDPVSGSIDSNLTSSFISYSDSNNNLLSDV